MNKNMILIILSIVILVAVFFGLYFIYNQEEFKESKEEEKRDNNLEIANPASTKCLELGGKLEEVSFDNGVDNYCVFEDNSRCFEWDLYRGICNKGELVINVIKEGEGKRANKGNSVTVHYTGKLLDGTKFDSSIDRGQPFSFILGQNRVIKGWEQGVLGMKIGEKRELTISPNLGYGQSGAGNLIPPNATLIFEVELLGIQ